MQFITTGNRIAVENFTIGDLYTITFESGTYINCACIGIGANFVSFQRNLPELLFTLTMETAELVSSIDLYAGGTGTTNYNELTNKPQIGGVELVGNKSLSDLGIQAEITEESPLSSALVSGLGSAAAAESSDFATAAQGALAASAIQSAGTGLSKDGTTLNHSNSVTAKTSEGFAAITYDAQGHITGSTAATTAQLAALNSGITSTDVDQIETNKNNISSLTENGGGKNLLNHTATTQGIWTVNTDKTITATGTGAATLNLLTITAEKNTGNLFKNCILSGCPNVSGCNISIERATSPYTAYAVDTGNGAEIGDIPSNIPIVVFCRVGSGTTVNNAIFQPMISKTGGVYQPPALSNAELTNNISSLTPDIKRVVAFSGGTTYSMVSDCTLTLVVDDIAPVYRISGFLGQGSAGIRGIILSKSNNSADFDTDANVLCKAEQSSGIRSTLACDDIWFNSTDNPRYVYCWVKLASSGTGRVYTIAERLG